MSTLEKILTSFEKLAATSSRLKKDEIVKDLIRDSKAKAMLTEILTYCYHPYWNYWIKCKHIESETHDEVTFQSWMAFRAVLDTLKARHLTGNSAREFLEKTLRRVSGGQRCVNFFLQVLNRDIKIGYKLKSFEKHLGEIVPKFHPMLACQWDEEEMDYEVSIEPKLDGLRCLIIFPENGKPTTVSRNGRPIYNTETILKEMEGSNNYHGLVFDGELIGSSNSWGSGISAAHSKNKKVKGLTFVAFDILELKEWEARKSHKEFSSRRKDLESVLMKTKHVRLSPVIEEGKLSTKKIKALGDRAIENGYEGIIIKPNHMRYMFKRCNSWMKYKFKRTDEFKVVGRLEGKHKNTGNLGAIIVEGKVDGVKVRSEVGQGFTDAMRKKLWKMPERELKELIVEVEHYGTTSSLRLKKDSKKLAALRNGVFIKIREDKMER